MIKISFTGVFFTLLSCTSITQGFSPSDSEHNLSLLDSKSDIKQKPQKKSLPDFDLRRFGDFLKDDFLHVFFAFINSPINENIDLPLSKTFSEMYTREIYRSAYFCLENNIPEESIRKFFRLKQKAIGDLKKIRSLIPLNKKIISYKKKEEKESIEEQIENLTNAYFPLSPEEKKNIEDLDIFMEPMKDYSSEKERIQRATFLLSNADPRFLPYEKIAQITHLDSSKIEELKSMILTTEAEEQTILTKKEQSKQKDLLDKKSPYFFTDGEEEDIKKLLINKIPVDTISAILKINFYKVKKLAKFFNLEIKEIKKIKLPKEKAYLAKKMDIEDSIEERENRVRELLKENHISLEKISSISHISVYNIRKLAKIWDIRRPKEQKKESYNIPKKDQYLLENMNLHDSLKKRIKRAEELIYRKISPCKISSITHITYWQILKLAEKLDIKITEGKNTFKFPEDAFLLSIKMHPHDPLEKRQQRAKELLMIECPVSKIEKITHIYFKKIRKLAQEWKIPVRKNKITV